MGVSLEKLVVLLFVPPFCSEAYEYMYQRGTGYGVLAQNVY
jgi:hypothetical protein